MNDKQKPLHLVSDRNTILGLVRSNQPGATPLPDLSVFSAPAAENQASLLRDFTGATRSVGGQALQAGSYEDIAGNLGKRFNDGRIVNRIAGLAAHFGYFEQSNASRDLHNVTLAIVPAHFGVAENGAVWVTEEQMGPRVMPFICQHLAVVIQQDRIVPTMHEAYRRIGAQNHNYGVFISGPSKTADIEQSLVLGAHGPRSLTVFMLA